MDQKSIFIDQFVLEEQCNQLGATGYENVLARLVLEIGDIFGDISHEQMGIVPLQVLQRPGDDELG
jgi:hypothetical protein